MLRVKTIFVASKEMNDWVVRWVGQRRTGNTMTPPLLHAFVNANGFFSIRTLRGAEFRVNEPYGLREESQQKRCCEKLGTSESFAGEIWAHRAKPSVLP